MNTSESGERVTKGTLLIVDDIPDNIMLLFKFLNRAGFRVLAARDGEQALDIARQAGPDLILLDIMMPGMDGYEVCRQLKDDSRTHDIPVMFMTALTDMQDKLKGFELGAADYIAKPVERAEVLARVSVHVRLSQLQRELQEKNRELKDKNEILENMSLQLSERNTALQREIEDKRRTEETLREEIQKKLEAEQALQTANQELKRLANLDGLTKIANRRRFDEYFQQEWSRMSRERYSLCLVLCDIDHFKAYNDNYGHQAGDECLQKIAEVLTSSARRPADLVARYGGEEFALILPNTDADGALAVATQVRRELYILRLPHEHSPAATYVTLSMGVACTVPENHHTPQAFLAAADRALYRAKWEGRNRIIVSENPFPETNPADAGL